MPETHACRECRHCHLRYNMHPDLDRCRAYNAYCFDVKRGPTCPAFEPKPPSLWRRILERLTA